jgi:branched-chain amino acid transport system substrate-binding protein
LRSSMISLVGRAFAVAACLAVTAHAASSQESINIGLVFPLSGPNSEYAKNYFIQPTELAAKEQNEQGGVLGKQVKTFREDSHSDGAGAVAALTKLADVNHVLAVFSSFTPLTLPQLPVAEERHIIVLAPSVEHPDLTKSRWAVRMTPTADKAGIVIAQTAEKMGMKTMAVISEDNEAIRITVRTFEAEFQKLGGKVVGDETFKTTDTDMRGQLTKLRAAKPDALYIMVSSGRPIALTLKQVSETGFKVKQIYANHLVEDREVKAMGGGLAEGIIYTTLDIDPAFSERFKAALGYAPDANAGKHYDATRLLFAAIKRVGSADDPAKVRDAIYNFGEYKSVVGDLKYEGSGEPVIYPILKIVKGDNYVDYTP